MAETITQTDTVGNCAAGLSCATKAARAATPGGTAGVTEVTLTAASESTCSAFNTSWVSGADYSYDAGTWTVRTRITTANANLSGDEVRIQHLGSGCEFKATMGVDSTPVFDPSTIGTYTDTVVSGTSSTGVSGDQIAIKLAVINAAMSSQSFGITPDQDIDSPFTALGGVEGHGKLLARERNKLVI